MQPCQEDVGNTLEDGRGKATSVYNKGRPALSLTRWRKKTVYLEAERDVPLPVRARMGGAQKAISSKELMS